MWLTTSALDKAPATVRRRKASVTEYLKFLGEDTNLRFKLPGAPGPDPHPLPNGMVGVNDMGWAASGATQTLLVFLCGRLGLRVSEAIAVKSTDYDPIKRALKVLGKGAKYRTLPVSDSMHEMLELAIEDLKGSDERLVPFANSTARELIKAIAVKAGLGSEVASHDLRATFATDMYARTKDILVVQAWLGHSSPETTRRYVEVKLDTMRQAL